MPHDKNGSVLKAGDRVTVACVVESVSPGEFCNCSLKTVEVMPGNGEPSSISAINCRQVELVGPEAAALPSWLNPAVVLRYARQIDEAAGELLRAGVPYLERADEFLHLVIAGAKAGKSGSEIAADIVAKWNAGELGQ